MNFSFHTYDEINIRNNPTTQVAIESGDWPGNTFLLWLPECVQPLWTQWTPEVAHQDFVATAAGGLSWRLNVDGGAAIEAALQPGNDLLRADVRVTNGSAAPIEHLRAQNCFHLSKAPDFACSDYSRIFIRVGGIWTSVKELDPTHDWPLWYREGFLEGRLGPVDPEDTHVLWEQQNQAAKVDHPMIVCLSTDGRRGVGIASDTCCRVFHNCGIEYLLCIHSMHTTVPLLAAGQQATFRHTIYFSNDGLAGCVDAFQRDAENGRN